MLHRAEGQVHRPRRKIVLSYVEKHKKMRGSKSSHSNWGWEPFVPTTNHITYISSLNSHDVFSVVAVVHKMGVDG